MSTIRDDIGWMICHSWDCGDSPSDVAVLNTEKLKDKLERYVAEREEQLKRENAALREAAAPFAEHWGEWLHARADHLHPDQCNERNPLWRNYQIVGRNIMRLRAALSPQEAARG